MDKFAALADPTRRQIIELLARHAELSATEIARHFPSSPPAISQHLKVLRDANLIVMGKTGAAAYLPSESSRDGGTEWVVQK